MPASEVLALLSAEAEVRVCVTELWSAVLDLMRGDFLSGCPQVAAQCVIPPPPSRGCAGLASLCRPRCNTSPPCPPPLPALQGCLGVDAGNRAAPVGRVWPGVLCREARAREGRGEGEGEISAPPPPLTVAREVHIFPLPAAERCPNGGASRAVVGEDHNFPLPAAAQCLSVGAPRWRSPPPPTGQGEVVAGEEWGEGDRTHPIPASDGVGGHSPPLGGDHNFPLPEVRDPHGGRFRPKVVWQLS